MCVIDCIRASCMAPRLTTATRAVQASSQLGGTSPHIAAAIIPAATILAAAKNGASWAREISWMSFSGVLSPSAGRLLRPSDSPPGSRAEIIRL